MPRGLRSICKKLFVLKFDQEPNYDDLITQIKEEIQKEEDCLTHKFEWVENEKDVTVPVVSIKHEKADDASSLSSNTAGVHAKLFGQFRSKFVKMVDSIASGSKKGDSQDLRCNLVGASQFSGSQQLSQFSPEELKANEEGSTDYSQFRDVNN